MSMIALGTAVTFALFASSTITNAPSVGTVITGDMGLFPGTEITGFPPGLITGNQYPAGAYAGTVKGDVQIAYDDAAGQPMNTSLTSVDLGGLTLPPAVYKWDTSAAFSAGQLFLDAKGDHDAVWVFQIGSSLTIAGNTEMVFTSGVGNPNNVFWQVGSSATLNGGCKFIGNLLAYASVSCLSQASVSGRLFALNGAVSLINNDVTRPSDAPTSTPTIQPTCGNYSCAPSGQPTSIPTFAPSGEPTNQPTSAPTNQPSAAPTKQPTAAPTDQPTNAPTHQPTTAPTYQPTTDPTFQPTMAPTNQPTMAPSNNPTIAPTNEPTTDPTYQPTMAPTNQPTMAPSNQPTTARPTNAPTNMPTTVPTSHPTMAPTNLPTTAPTQQPTTSPTNEPTMTPTEHPTVMPSAPTSQPSLMDATSRSGGDSKPNDVHKYWIPAAIAVAVAAAVLVAAFVIFKTLFAPTDASPKSDVAFTNVETSADDNL